MNPSISDIMGNQNDKRAYRTDLGVISSGEASESHHVSRRPKNPINLIELTRSRPNCSRMCVYLQFFVTSRELTAINKIDWTCLTGNICCWHVCVCLLDVFSSDKYILL